MKNMDVKLNGGNFEELKENLKKALEKSGFSILSEYDFKKILTSKGKRCDMNVYIIEACEAGKAAEVLNFDPMIGSLLPCKISLIEKEDGYHMAYMDPQSVDIRNPQISGMMFEIGEMMSKIANSI